ncbi:MRG/MORF4L-binding protein-like isoform X3 [Anopheles albimanus]|uniref:Uncharacterized protein n=1 Tax=Anopheles albimanus TaxID=7167 RepID=A0A182FV41_ANOAL|nr:MRG/MORF4L-binding protein-like isoform X3 [Anopheles albimanus]
MTTLVREKQDSESSEWTAEEEVQLFLAMDGVKPVGVNRHFYMACITERLGKALQREVASEAIWTHLRSMYNLKALDEQEFVPFLNEECDFDLPEADFSAAIGRRKQEDTERLAVPPAVCEPDAKKSESKSDTAMVKVAVSKPAVQPKDGKEHEREEKEGREREPGSSGKIKAKVFADSNGSDGGPKRSQKRTRGSLTNEPTSNTSSPANTPPNGPGSKRRRI